MTEIVADMILAYEGHLDDDEKPAAVEPVFRLLGGTEFLVGSSGRRIERDELDFMLSLGDYTRIEPAFSARDGHELWVFPDEIRYDLPDRIAARLDALWKEKLTQACGHLVRLEWEDAELPLSQAGCAKSSDPVAYVLRAAISNHDRRFKHAQAALDQARSAVRGGDLVQNMNDAEKILQQIHPLLPQLVQSTLSQAADLILAETPLTGSFAP